VAVTDFDLGAQRWRSKFSWSLLVTV